MSLPVRRRKCTHFLLILLYLCVSPINSLSIAASDSDIAASAASSPLAPSFPKTQAENTASISGQVQIPYQNTSLVSNSTSEPNKSRIQVEDLLKEIFEAEFEDEPNFVQNDDNIAAALEESTHVVDISDTNRTEALTTAREGRAQFHQNRRGRRPHSPKRKEINRKRQALAQKSQKQTNRQNGRPAFAGGLKNQNGAQRPNAKGKGVDLTKYNAYMDAVLSRMNALIRKKRMDPLRVNLYAGPSPGQGQKKGQGLKNKKNGNQGNRIKKKGGARWEDDDSGSQMVSDEDDGESGDRDDSGEEEGRAVRDFTVIKPNVFQRRMRALENSTEESNVDKQDDVASGDVDSKVEDDVGTEGRGKVKADSNGKGNKGQVGGEKKGNKDSQTQNTRLQTKTRIAPRPTRGILHGLSSLRRDGSVQVIKDGEKARIIRSRFLLGPVALEILPKKTKRKHSREDLDDEVKPSQPPPPAATATAPQLKGILEIRLSPGNPTRIRKLRVFPPGNIQVDGDKKSGTNGVKRAGYRKVTPMATARLRQTAIQVLRQVDNKMKTKKLGQEDQLL